jgi:murein DD-endopeptidase MepM/ murein hydrolase activator NlpD
LPAAHSAVPILARARTPRRGPSMLKRWREAVLSLSFLTAVVAATAQIAQADPVPPAAAQPTPLPCVAGDCTASLSPATDERSSTDNSADYAFPVRGPHSYGGSDARYGAPRAGHQHEGQDVAAGRGTPVAAARGGRVYYKSYQAGGAGHYVVISGTDNRDYVYMHLAGPASVNQGQFVRTGQQIANVGSTGESSGPHLHFEMWTQHWRHGGHSFDPRPYLDRWDREHK